MTQLLLATTNTGKVKELRALLHDLEFELVTPNALHLDLDVEESGATYAENAALKALTYCKASGIPTLADDSGLEVDVLGGLPGLHSARFSPEPGATDADRRTRLLELLHEEPHPWYAQFRCIVAIAVHGEIVHYTEGTCPGEIISEERGENGFGYDPIFFLPELDRTMAELPMQEKNRISHRARAVKAAIPFINKMIHHAR